MTMPSPALLEVEDLSVWFRTDHGEVNAVDRVSFNVRPGERIGIVGESGCGKSVTAMALMQLNDPLVSRNAGRVMLDGQDINRLSPRAMRKVCGADISMIFQEPMRALDPVFPIGEQIVETLLAHRKMTRAEAVERVIEALSEVGIPAPRQRFHDYPHALSGGMQQRVMIAMALICKPKLVIADEPTTALDVTVQAQIIDLLYRLCDETDCALLFVTHDLGVVAEFCERVMVFYAGQLVEDAPIEDVFLTPKHPYTAALFASLPSVAERGKPLPSIGGRVPSLMNMPEGCRFFERCKFGIPDCKQPQSLRVVNATRVRCVRSAELTLQGATHNAKL